MRATLLSLLTMPLFLGSAGSASGEDAATAEAESPPTPAEAAAPASVKTQLTDDKIYLPAGFRPKKRGKYLLYCRKEDVMGTRFPVEKCYDERGIRDYVLDQRENQKQVDQMRRICGSMEACGGGS